MTSLIAAGGSGRSTSVIPAVPAASSVTTIAFIRHPLYPVLATTLCARFCGRFRPLYVRCRGTRPDEDVVVPKRTGRSRANIGIGGMLEERAARGSRSGTDGGGNHHIVTACRCRIRSGMFDDKGHGRHLTRPA